MSYSDTTVKKVVLLDGGTGMSLAHMGHPEINDKDPLWSASIVQTHPDDLVKLHKEFFLSGANVVVTATYQASIEGYMSRFHVEEAEAIQLVQKSVKLAQDARDQAEALSGHRGYVAASIGPYGATLCDMSEYHGKYVDTMTKQELSDWHLPRIKQVESMKPDLLAIETIPALKEAEAILDVLSTHFPKTKAWLTFQCKDDYHTAHGEHIQDVMRAVTSNPQVVAVGINCVEPRLVSSLIQSIAQLNLSIPIIAKPNSGQVITMGEPNSPKTSITDMVEEWVSDGASLIGGCCFIGPSDIQEIHQKLETSSSISLVSLNKVLQL